MTFRSDFRARRAGLAAAAAGALATSLALTASVAFGDRPAPAPRVTEPFRAEHADIRVHLDHIHRMAGELRAATPDARLRSMRFVVKFLDEHIGAHAAWEEKVLYPVVDRLAGGGKHPFTATMRHEHGVVGRWIAELGTEAAKDSPDADAFARRTDNLLGLLWAHFEEEEEVLLPLIDAGMSADQFKREVLDRLPAH